MDVERGTRDGGLDPSEAAQGRDLPMSARTANSATRGAARRTQLPCRDAFQAYAWEANGSFEILPRDVGFLRASVAYGPGIRPSPNCGAVMCKAESPGRAARILMKHRGEVLLRLKACACRDIDQRETSFEKHHLRKSQPRGDQIKVWRKPRRILESMRKMRRAHVHKRSETLDRNVLRDVFVNEVFHDAQLQLGEPSTSLVRMGVAAVPAREVK